MYKLILALLFIVNFTQAQKLDLSMLENLEIRNVGPANMSGRITAIDVVGSDPKVIYLGAASGGVWKSENGGSAWEPIFDEQDIQNIGAVAVNQENPSIVWVGTGEGNPRNSMNLGDGVFKSVDSGKTWKQLGLEQTKTIHRILTDPRNEDIVYVGSPGDPFTPNEHRGLYKSTDGGKTWQNILFTNKSSGVADMVMDPSNPNKILVAMYEHRRTPYYMSSGGEGSGLYLTMDAGETWKQITSDNGMPEGELGRIGLAIAPSDSDVIYAKIEAKKSALYKSEDGGLSWDMINDNPRYTNNRPFYFQDLAVDSKDPNRLYNIYQPLTVSYDGGKNFDPTPMIPADETKGIHADFHAFWVNKEDPEHFIIGGDGGIGITYDHGRSWYFPENIPVAQFYQINVDEDVPYNVYGGMQDNGNWSGPGYTWKRGGIRTLYWQYLVGGDGFYIKPDRDNSRFGFGTSQNGDLYRYDKLTGYYQSIKPPSPNLETRLRFNWNAGFAEDPFKEGAIYYGSQFVHKTNDKGQSWKVISPDLSSNNPEHQKRDYGGLTLDVSGAEVYNSILAIAPSPMDSNIIWAGTDDGQISLSTDAGGTWKSLTSNVNGLPKESWIARIFASPHNANTAWLIVNNYRKGDYKPYLFVTTDLGKTWTSILTNGIVKGYSLSFIQDPQVEDLLFLGTEQGLWISIDRGSNWVQFKNGFPSVSTMDLKIQKRESALIVGTFGRAIWILDDLKSLKEIASKQIKPSLTALPMNDVVQVKGLFIAPPGNIWSGFHTTFEGKNRVFQKTKIPFFIATEMDTSEFVTAEIYDDSGSKINEVTNNNNVKGLNYMIWKLDEKSAYLPGAWIHEESRGIPVLPGRYMVVLSSGNERDSSWVEVKPDPRFSLEAEIDEDLYSYRREVNIEVERLAELLNKLDEKKAHVNRIMQRAIEDDLLSNDKRLAFTTILEALASIRSKGQTPRPDRQLGAWQSFEVNAHSKVRQALSIAAARVVPISAQERKVVEEARMLIDNFEQEVEIFEANVWNKFQKQVLGSN